jgi:hypothetical protein
MKFFKPILLILLATFALASTAKTSDNELATGSQTFGGFVNYVAFIKLDFAAYDVGCGSEGDVCAVGINKKLYCYDFVQNKWDLIPTNEEITEVLAVDVDDDGRIYIIAQCGIYFFDCTDKWVKLPGSGKDIGVGVNFDVWKIGTDKESATSPNYGLWKLFCDCKCDCVCTRLCLRFRKLNFFICDPIEKRKCIWFRADVYGVAVDVYPNGDAALVKADGKVFIVDAMTFDVKEVVAVNNPAIKAVDVTVGNNGVLIITSDAGKVYKYDTTLNKWIEISVPVPGVRICASAYDIPFYTAKNTDPTKQYVYTAARYDYI